MKPVSASGPFALPTASYDPDTDTVDVIRVRFETVRVPREDFETGAFPTLPPDLPEAVEVADHVALAAGNDGAWLIARERRRQIEVEGITEADDDDHLEGELATAARCYLQVAEMQAKHGGEAIPVHYEWPWFRRLWKPSDEPIRNLEKAGALIAAEIDRLRREEINRIRAEADR